MSKYKTCIYNVDLIDLLKESPMNENEKIINFRLDALEANHKELKIDIREVKDLCVKMDKKLSGIPQEGLQCNIHTLKVEGLTKRVDKVEGLTDNLTKKIVSWTSVIAVIIFIISQVLIPYVLGNYKITPTSPTASTPYIQYDPAPGIDLTAKPTNSIAKTTNKGNHLNP